MSLLDCQGILRQCKFSMPLARISEDFGGLWGTFYRNLMRTHGPPYSRKLSLPIESEGTSGWALEQAVCEKNF
jgi:hypothetical protein